MCVCAVSCVDGSCRSNRPLAEALKATDTLDLLSHTLIVPQGWINPYPRELAMAMRLNASTPAHAVANSGSLLASLSGCAFTLGEERCAALLEETYVKTESLVWLGTDDDLLDEQLGL